MRGSDMATRRRRTTARRRTSRPVADNSEFLDEVVIPMARFAGELWDEVSDEHKRDLAGVVALLAGLAVLGSAFDPALPALHAVHRLVWWSTGHGWPLVALGLLASSLVLIHPPKAPV